VLKRVNEGQHLQAAAAMELWRKSDVDGEGLVVDALVRRRAAEKALFLTPDGGWIPAPSAVIEPKADHGLAVAAPESPATDAVIDGADEASPVERAAANLAARLQALALDEPPAAEIPATEPPVAVAELPSEPAPFPGAVQPEPAPPPVETPIAPFEPTPPAPSDVEALRRTIFGVPEPRPRLELGAYAPLALLGGAGLAVFIAAVIWAFHSKPTGGALTPLNIGVVLVGFIGILGVASAVYLVLEKLAGRDQ
jgi:lysozyme